MAGELQTGINVRGSLGHDIALFSNLLEVDLQIRSVCWMDRWLDGKTHLAVHGVTDAANQERELGILAGGLGSRHLTCSRRRKSKVIELQLAAVLVSFTARQVS